MYSNAAFYNVLRGNPFTAYGETLVVQIQTVGVVALIWRYKEDPRIGKGKMGLALAAFMVYLILVFQGENYFSLFASAIIHILK